MSVNIDLKYINDNISQFIKDFVENSNNAEDLGCKISIKTGRAKSEQGQYNFIDIPIFLLNF